MRSDDRICPSRPRRVYNRTSVSRPTISIDNEILRVGSTPSQSILLVAIWRELGADAVVGGTRPPTQDMTSFVDVSRGQYGVEPICRELPIALLSYCLSGGSGQLGVPGFAPERPAACRHHVRRDLGVIRLRCVHLRHTWSQSWCSGTPPAIRSSTR